MVLGLIFWGLGFGDVCGLETAHPRLSFSLTMQAGGRLCLTPSLRAHA